MLRFNDAPGTQPHDRRAVIDGARVALPSRCRLIERLIEETAGSAGMQRLTLVCAPTGYGKTATIADWLGGETAGAFPVRWLHCVQGPSQPLWESMIAVLAPLSDARPAEGTAPAASVLALARGLRSGITLVVDDYQLITSAATDMALAELSAASPQLSLVVIGRRVTLLDGPLVSATTRVRIIGTDDLKLTPAEAAELAQSLGVPVSPSLAAAIERCDGWPLAIRAALNLGSDVLYADTAAGRVWSGGPAARTFDPLANLGAYALASLEIMHPDARSVVLASAQIDSFSLAQIRDLLGTDDAAATATVQHLTELGFLVPTGEAGPPEYRCHRAMRTPFAEFAANAIPLAERQALYRGRAAEIAATAPFTAFRLFCAAEDFAAAEVVLAQNFTTLTDEGDACASMLRALPESVLHTYPTLTAALLFLENPQVGVSPSRLRYLLQLWQSGLARRLPEGAKTAPGPLHLHLLCESMVMNRVLGDLDAARALLHHIEARFTPAQALAQSANAASAAVALADSDDAGAVLAGNGSLSVFYRELAGTALAVGDFGRARRNLKRLRRHAERKISAPWHGFPHASTRTVTDAESGANWLVGALAELAFTDTIDGHIRRAGELLYELDTHVATSGATAPGLAWVGAEIARAHLAQENGDGALLERARERLSLIGDRLEPWPMLLIAEAAAIRGSRGIEFALTHFVAGLAAGTQLAPIPKAWCPYIVNFEAMLNSSVGNLTRAAELIARGPADEPSFRLERARLEVFSGNDVEALLLAQGVGDPGTTKRQRVDRRLITAVAAWGCGHTDEALTALQAAVELIDKYFLPAMLLSVPYELLHGLAVAAREAGVCDIVDMVERIPGPARAQRFEQLTEMELRTLLAIAEHRNANQAAASLFVTAGTVKKHLAAVYRKLGVRDRDSAILRAGKMGLLAAPLPAAG